MMETYLIDTHSHINMIKETGIDEVIQNAEKNGVRKIIVPAAEPEDISQVMELVNRYENVYRFLGIHPSDAKQWRDDLIEEITELAKNKKIVGIGEIGLDYYWDKSYVDIQKDVFIKQIKLANKLNLPIDVHDRDAHQDTFNIIQEHNQNSKVIMHCYSGSLEFAKECVKAGYYIGIGGVVTFKNAVKIKEVAKHIPLEHILLETDAPFLSPVPFRGKENQPAYVKYVAQEIADLRGISYEEVASVTTRNAEEVFGI